jgi:hypothetical protein
MLDQRKRKDPTRGVAIFFVVVVLLVLGAILYKGISGRRAYEAEQAAADAAARTAPPASAPAGEAPAKP